MDIAEIEKEALDLPSKVRAELAHRLLESLDRPSESEAEAAWRDEAQRRAAELDSGAVRTVSAEELEARVQEIIS